ncbi:MAG: glycosyltransferase family 2 protein [Butyrivibrio sp.]|nr:glycosyltransferase family 2 protein [Butyrivibrio sp.]
MSNVKISVIIPCHNTEKYLSDCLKSLEKQTLGIENLQVILVNDASEDGTWQIISDFEKRHPRETIAINLEKNMMQGAARNIALQYVEGKYVRFLDSDDCFQENSCKLLYELAEERDLDLICFECLSFRDEDGFTDNEVLELSIRQIYDFSDRETRSSFLLSDEIGYNHWKKFYRTSLLQRSGATFYEGATVFEEAKFVFPQYLHTRNAAVVDNRLTYNRIRHGSASKASAITNTNRVMCNAEAQKSLLDFLKEDHSIFELYKNEIIDFFFWHFYYETCEFALRYQQFMKYEEYDWMRTVVLEELSDDNGCMFVNCNPASVFFIDCMKKCLVKTNIDVILWCGYVNVIMTLVLKNGGYVNEGVKSLMQEVVSKLS